MVKYSFPKVQLAALQLVENFGRFFAHQVEKCDAEIRK